MANIDGVKLPDNREFNIKDSISGYSSKVSSATDGHLAGLNASGDLTDSGVVGADVVTKVTGGTTGNFAGLDANGKIVDSGSKASDFLTSHQDISGKADKTDISGIVTTGATNSTGATITAGTYFYLNGALVKAKVDIANGATYTSGTNYEAVTVGGQLTALNSKLINISVTATSQYAGTNDWIQNVFGIPTPTKMTRVPILVFNRTNITSGVAVVSDDNRIMANIGWSANDLLYFSGTIL